LLLGQARHQGRTMDAFLTPGAMFNVGIAHDPETSDDDSDTAQYVHMS
jgi:hypothetical protein